ncbi:MAG TPA: hypothetical protein VHA11_10205, partial [Bryobacteraceae bacterium]|nr:hypothetical protein [Bryobacteraceae bacterium]
MRTFAVVAAALAMTLGTAAEPPQDDPILRAMRDELARARALKVVSQATPYYIEYALHDADNVSVSATLGALLGSNRSRFRLPRIQVRVGDYAFDNTNFVGTDFVPGTHYDVGDFPLDNSYPVLRHHLWLATDMAYKRAVEAYSLKQASLKNVTQNEELADFYPAKPVEDVTGARVRTFDQAGWAARVRRLSALFLDYPGVTRSTVSFEAGRGVQYLVTSEGTRLRIQEGSAALRVRAVAQAADGMLLRDALVFHAFDPDRMAPDAEVERGIREVAANLTSLAQAPVGESYSGPVLFEGMAAPQMFAQLLGRNLAP